MSNPDYYLTLQKYLELENNNFNNNTYNFSQKTLNTVKHIVKSILNAECNISKIDIKTEEGRELLEYEGFTGTKTRHFYNNICSNLNDIRYLEIGTWYGSSSISAVYNNNISALFIDNWSQFGGTPDKFKTVIKKFSKNSKCYLLESDCWKVNLSNIGKYNIYLYDGDHSELDHYKALTYYINNLDDEFIYIVDDYNWPNVRDGTMRAINDLNLNVKFKHEIFVSSEDVKGMPNHNGKKTWWNGMGCFLIEKPKTF